MIIYVYMPIYAYIYIYICVYIHVNISGNETLCPTDWTKRSRAPPAGGFPIRPGHVTHTSGHGSLTSRHVFDQGNVQQGPAANPRAFLFFLLSLVTFFD